MKNWVLVILIVGVFLVVFLSHYNLKVDDSEKYNFNTGLIEVKHINYFGWYTHGYPLWGSPRPIIGVTLNEWYAPVSNDNCSIQMHSYDSREEKQVVYRIICDLTEEEVTKIKKYYTPPYTVGADVTREELESHDLPIPIEEWKNIQIVRN